MSSVDQSSWHVDGHHWVSPINYESIRQPSIDFPEPLRIYDYTLAKMIYTPGVSPPIKDMLRVAAALEEAGVRDELRDLRIQDLPPDSLLSADSMGECPRQLERSHVPIPSTRNRIT